MKNVKETFATLQKLSEWRGYVNRERFISYAKAFGLRSDRDAESLWKVWNCIAGMKWYELQEESEARIDLAISIACRVYEVVCNGAYIHWRENTPKTPRWRVYYRHGRAGELQCMDVNLLEKDGVIKYALLLQQDGVEIFCRLDYCETVVVSCGTTDMSKGEKLDIYDGDIIFCTDSDRWSISDNSGAYVCVDGCYKRLMYTPGRGYIRKGDLDFELDKDGKDCRYNKYVFNAYNRKFQVAGNIFVDNGVLVEKKNSDYEKDNAD